MTMTATIGIEVNHTIMTMTAIIDRSKSSYHTIMTMTATIGRHKSTYGSCHGHDCMIVGFTSIPMVAVIVMIV
jgi:hypothetical protein